MLMSFHFINEPINYPQRLKKTNIISWAFMNKQTKSSKETHVGEAFYEELNDCDIKYI